MDIKGKLIRIDDGGVDEDGRKQEIIIDGVTHLGRASEFDNMSNPEVIEDAELNIRIEDPNLVVAERHAIIYPPEGDFRNFQIRHLAPDNSTIVNKWEIKPGRTEFIPEKGVVQLGSGPLSIRFLYEPYDSGMNPNYALMVGHYGENRRSSKRDAEDLRTELLYKGYAGNIITLHDTAATRIAVIKALNLLKGKVTKDSDFIFYFAGHGNKKGELCFGNEKLDVRELFAALSQFRGRICMILDGYYTDSLASEVELPSHSCLIGHSAKSREDHSPTLMIDTNALDEKATSGYLTRAVLNVLRAGKLIADELGADPNIRILERSEYHSNREIRLSTTTQPNTPGGALRTTPILDAVNQQSLKDIFIRKLRECNPDVFDMYARYNDAIGFRNLKGFVDAAKEGFLKSMLTGDFPTAERMYLEFLKGVDLSKEITKAYIEFVERGNFHEAAAIYGTFVLPGHICMDFSDADRRRFIEEKYISLKTNGRTDDAQALGVHLSKTGIDFDALDKESQADGEIPIQPREYVHQEVVINESEQAMDLFTKFLCERKFDVAATVYQKFGLNGKPGFEQALKNAVRMCLETDDPQDAALIKHDYGVGIDFFKEIEAGLIAVLDRNDKKHCRHYVACLPDESRQAYFNVLSNGLSYYAEILRKILTEQGVMVMPEAYQRAAYQGYLKNLERGDLSTANDFYDKFYVENSIQSPEELKAAINKGFYQCLITGDFKTAKAFLKRGGNLIDTQNILLRAYNDCIHLYPDKLEIATQIKLKFRKLAKFPE